MWKRRGRLSPREQKEQIQASHRAVAASIEDPVKRAAYERDFVRALPPKRAAPTPSGRKLERAVNDEIYDAVKKLRLAELWRNNRGVALYGNQHVRYGVGPNGASDWIGYRRILVTAEMVGRFVAQFVAVEAKAPGEDLRRDQRLFIDRVTNDGGCAGVARSAEDVRRILE